MRRERYQGIREGRWDRVSVFVCVCVWVRACVCARVFAKFDII